MNPHLESGGLRGRDVWLLPVIALLATACGDSPTGTDPLDLESRIEAAFAPPTPAEIALVRQQWDQRFPRAQDAVLVESIDLPFGGRAGEGRVYSHRVDGNIHYGAVLVPDAEGGLPLPVLIYGHPGDGGVSLAELTLVRTLLGSSADEFVIVAPSFRSETLAFGSRTYTSGGTPSPWDRDVDDALALLEVVLENVPLADPDRIYAAGFSRGAGVALLAAVRDPRIRAVVEIAGPTDFISDYVRAIVEEALSGELRSLPGLRDLDRDLIQPFGRGEIAVDQLRLELLRRSPAHFAESLPPVQIHHGDADTVVDYRQAVALAGALEALGRDSDEAYIYPGAGHLPFGMIGIDDRIRDFLGRWLATPSLGAPAEVRRSPVAL